MPGKKEIQEIISTEIMNKEDLIFTHSIFVQCFLPVRSLPKGQDFYSVKHGNASFALQAGHLVNPDNNDEWEKREVPAGGKARLLFAYINDYAIRTKEPFVDMCDSLREFMKRNGIPVGGANAKELTRQAKNIAAADIMMGIWGEKKVSQSKINIVRDFTFWADKKDKKTIWEPTMLLSEGYLNALEEYKVPLDFRSLVALQANPRAMDVYTWLSYKLRTLKRAPVKIPYMALHPIFGQGIKQLKHFKIHFKKAVIEAVKFYPDARIELNDTDYIVLRSSPSPVPTKSSIGSSKGMFGRKKPKTWWRE